MAKRPGPGPIPQVPGYPDLRRLPGGHTHEMFLATGADGRDVVVRVFGAGTRTRGPEAPAVQAGVLRLTRGLLPVPELIELREDPPLLVVSRLPGVSLHSVLGTASTPLQHRLGESMGEILGRLSGIALTGPGGFLDGQQTLAAYHPDAVSLVTWLDAHYPGTALADIGEYDALRALAERGDALLAGSARAVLVHGDLSPRNVLCDPETGRITGLIDWEFTHAGHPVEDVGKLLRRIPGMPFVDATLAAMNPWLPAAEQARVEELKERARAADFYWLLEVASRRGGSPATERAWRIVRKLARTGRLLGDLEAAPGQATW